MGYPADKYFSDSFHLPTDIRLRNLRIAPCHVRIRVAQYLGDDVDRHPVFDRKRRKRMSCTVVGDRLVDSDLDGDSFQDAVTVGDVGHRQYEVRSRDLASVFVDDAFGNAA